jgi:hypothetical protein
MTRVSVLPVHPTGVDDLNHSHGGMFNSFQASHSEANGSRRTWDIYMLDGMLTYRTCGQSYLSFLCINRKQDPVNTLISLTTYQGIHKVLH